MRRGSAGRKCQQRYFVRKQNKGFTLVEMIVTMIVLAILLSLSVAGVIAWQDWSNFNRENEYARILYIAAQNQLSEFSADGRLMELQDSLSGGAVDDRTGRKYTEVGLNLTDSLSFIKNEEGEAYSLTSVYPESKDKTTQDLYQDEIVSLRAETGEYAEYLKNPAHLRESNPEAYWVFELLGSYVYDTSILNGSRQSDGSGNGASVCVEITPEDGQVFSVLYSDLNDRLVYLNIPDDPKSKAEGNGVADISDRTETYRKERMVGYYGVDTLYKATSNEIIRPSLSSVKLYNKETFYLTCRLSAEYRKVLTSQLTYVIDLNASQNVNDKKLTIKLDGTKLKNEQNAEVISCQVSRYAEDGTEITLGEFPVLAWVEPDYTVHVCLDAADIQATTDLYERELEDIRSEERASGTKFSKTLSFFRFGVEADNVYASVTATGDGFISSGTVSNFGNLNVFKNQEGKHPAFAGEKEKEGEGGTEYTYSVINARHLYNIRYVEDLSYEKEAGSPEAADRIAGVTFLFKSDINWAEFEENGNLYNSYDTTGNIRLSSLNRLLVDVQGNAIENVTRYNCDFPSISQVRVRDVIDGNGKTLTGISVSEIANVLYGTYYSEHAGTYEPDQNRPTGFINVNYGTVKDLKLDEINAAGADCVGGFCGINAGTASNLETLNSAGNSLIAGKKHVGGIIGYQLPAQNTLDVANLVNHARVEGVEAVGGILGMIRNEFLTTGIDLSELTGLSEQTRNLLADPDNLTIKIHDCDNFGEIAGVNTFELREIYTAQDVRGKYGADVGKKSSEAPDPEEPRYIGGIVGYCYNRDTTNADKITIEKCTSSPQYDSDTLLTILNDKEQLKERMKGVYVGGVVGYNYFGQINQCSSQSRKGKEGCLFGYRYVGGIAGFNIGPASGIVGSHTSKQGENDNHVIAYEYAGGITGCNASVRNVDSEDNDISVSSAKDPEKLIGLLLPDAERNLHVKIDNWVNKGVIIAVHAYAGGITGYNAGFIYRCNSAVQAADADTCFRTLYSGNYAGGIAGYNNGVIGNTERTISEDGSASTIVKTGESFSTVCYVKGHHYVGGIVGYNDVDSIVEDYEVASGYVLGDEGSCFVGGYAGLNASVDLLMNMTGDAWEARLIHSNPNRVEGSYFVGGNIGGNIINMADNPRVHRINGLFLTDNFLGILRGNAFVGGFIGYNLLFDNPESTDWIQNDPESYRGGVYILQRQLIDAFERADGSSSHTQDPLAEKKEILDRLSEKLNLQIGSTDKIVFLSGRGTESTKVSFGTISGGICVGGVMGYNDENTELYIKNVENATPIEATASIACKEEQITAVAENTGEITYRETDYNKNPKNYQYSYAGGIIGKTSKKATLDNCFNASTGTVKTSGTYTGGLCEVNEGIVKNCRLSNFGSSVQDYVGGLCGLNKGLITGCVFRNKTVSGRNVVGGITAENFGTITDISLSDAKLLVEGKRTENGEKDGVTGIFAAYNGTTGKIILKADIANVSVTSGGRFAGIVAGINEGTVENKKERQQGSLSDNLTLSGSIRGDRTVGGLIGLNKDQNFSGTVEYYTNRAQVTAVNGDAGGIIGENLSGNTIRYCINDAVVSASDSGNAGGITSINDSLITDCMDYRLVSAPEGMCGGITSVNKGNGIIRNCHVEPGEGLQSLTFRSTKSAGGVAAQNYGLIQGNFLKNVTITNETAVLSASMGVVTGDNMEGGRILFADSSLTQDGIENCKVIVQSNYSKAGGVAGTNAGEIRGSVDTATGLPSSVVNSSLSMDNATLASLGGVAGSNTGSIQNMAVDVKIIGKLGTSSTGYGGVVGFSGYANKKGVTREAGIRNCSFDGLINAEGSSGAPVRIGGIVGVNGYGAVVEDCSIGVRSAGMDGTVTEESGITYITAGDYEHKTADSVSTTDTRSYSYLGGIAGDNYGKVLACDNQKHSKDTVKVIGFAGECGGIVGFNYAYGMVSGYLEEETNTEHYLTTGEKWSVEQRCCDNDRGPGGIIGKSVSAEPLSYVKNHASVTCMYKSNNYAGGLIGVLGQQYDLTTKFMKCENYGAVSSYRNAGGLVGMLESGGADFTECTNWGNVSAKTHYAGGFVALHYTYTEPTDFRHCANHGNIFIEGSDCSIGGFVAKEDNWTGTVESYLYDCVNTGIIQKGTDDTAFSRAGVFFGNAGSRVIMELCRNYNTASGENGFVGTGGTVRMKNCLDDSNITTRNTDHTPFGGSYGGNSNLFYLNDNSKTKFSHKDYGVYFSFHAGPNGDFRMQGLRYRDQLKDPSYVFVEPSVSNTIELYDNNKGSDVKQFNLNLEYEEDSEGIDALVVYFWNGNNRTDSTASGKYQCRATYYYSDGTSITTGSDQYYQGYYEVTDGVKLVNPSATDKKPVQIRLAFNNDVSVVKLRGISYIPAAESSTGQEAVCSYLGKRYDTTFNITDITRESASGSHSVYTRGFGNAALPQDVWYCYNNDVMDINWSDYNHFRLEFSAGDTACIPFEVISGDEAPGMDSFVFYLANNNTNSNALSRDIRTYYYNYSVTFTDKNGKTVTTPTVQNACGYDSGEENYKERSRQVVKVPEELDPVITSIELHIKTVKYTWVDDKGVLKENSNEGRIYLRGFGWIPKGENTVERMAAGSAATNASLFDRGNNGENKQIRLGVDTNGSTPYVYLPYNYEKGFYMTYTGNDPISERYYGDQEEYEASVTESENSGSRIDTYLDLDPKFVSLTEEVCTVNRKLSTPVFNTTEQEACLQYSWNQVLNAYGYEVYYEVVNANGIIIASAHDIIGSLQLSYRIPVDNSWNTNGCHINFYVRALNAYHYAHDDQNTSDYDPDYQKYDSEWAGAEEKEIVKKTLPKPEVHMEIVAGNRTTFILDNYEDYVEAGCTDCTIKLYYNGQNYDWNVAEDGKYRKPEMVNGAPSGPVDFRYYAEPNEALKNSYTTSATHYQRGEGHGNNTLPDSARYCNTKFLGFFGKEADSLEFRIAFTLNSQDTYLVTDISAYDKTVGATVVYDSEITHAANSYSGGGQLVLTSTLKNLPREWFSLDKVQKITARAYPYRSQFEIIHYGHDVAAGITLNGTPAENEAVLANIYDDQYFTAESEKPVTNCIWNPETNDLKSGYLLQKQEDGTYNITYSSVVEMSQTQAALKREDGDTYREYYNYDVYYRIYSDFAAESAETFVVNSEDFQESYWSRGIADNVTAGYDTVRTDTNDRFFVQEIQPEPVVEDEVTAAVDEYGHTTYQFKWDTYYQDTACWNSGSSRYTNRDMKYLTKADGQFKTWDAYLKKAGLDNTDLSDNAARVNMLKLMNAYYNSYSTAAYRVDLIGTTSDGKEFVLDTINVDSPTSLGEISGDFTTQDGTTSTTYKVWDFRCTFTDTLNQWGTYPKLTARIMRLGSLKSVKTDNRNPKTDANGAVYLLPRYAEKSIDIKLKMNTISKPEVTLLKENGQFITSDLIYEVKWNAIMEENQKQDLGGYLITVKLMGTEAKPHYYYVTDVMDPSDTIGLDIAALEAEGTVADVTPDYIREDSTCRTRISLADFNTDDVVEISVKAIAKAGAGDYTDGAESVSTEITIPNRLKVPDVGKLTCTLAGTSDGMSGTDIPEKVEKSVYEEGFVFGYATDDYTDIADAQIVMAAAVFDEKLTDAESDSTEVTDGFDVGARRVLFTKEDPEKFGNANEGNAVSVKLTDFERYPGEFAGKWLKIALQATCETKIDSRWTDNDPDGKTINYVWIQIPEMILPDVSLNSADVVRDEAEDIVRTGSLSFAEEKNADGYSIEITGNENNSVYTLYLQRHIKDASASFDGTWDVYLSANTTLSVPQPGESRPVCEQDPDAVWIGRTGSLLTEEGTSENIEEITNLVEIADIHKAYSIESKTYDMTAQLRYTKDAADGCFTIVLPDITVVGETPYSGDEYFTQKVSVQQFVKPGMPYQTGTPASFERTAD